MARGVGGEGGAAGGRDPNAGGSIGGNRGGTGNGGRGRGGTFGDRFGVGNLGGPSRGIGGEGGAVGGRDPNAGGPANQGGNGGKSVSKPAKPTSSTVTGMGSFGGLPGQPTRDQMQTQDQMGANVAAAQRDYRGTDDSLVDRFGNFVGSMLGFNEMDPTVPGFSQPGMPGATGKANWGFDPVGALAGIGGMLGGAPIGVGLIADQISAALGRPLEVNLGPEVFQDDVTGQVTTTGGSMTVHDDDHFAGGNDKEFIGVPPDLAGLGGGLAPQQPTSKTLYGKDPAASAPAPTSPTTTGELPSGLSPAVTPNSVGVDVGNSGWSAEDLAALFQRFGTRVYGQQNRQPALV